LLEEKIYRSLTLLAGLCEMYLLLRVQTVLLDKPRSRSQTRRIDFARRQRKSVPETAWQ